MYSDNLNTQRPFEETFQSRDVPDSSAGPWFRRIARENGRFVLLVRDGQHFQRIPLITLDSSGVQQIESCPNLRESSR